MNNDVVGGQAQVARAEITDGRPRVVTFTSDLFAQVIRRDERDNLSGGDPHEVWHRFSGRQMGYVGNNGTLDTDYNTSINNRTATSAPGLSLHADFDLAYDSTNSYTQGSQRGMYVVQAGDSLSSIATALWGDASLWYKLAEINGLTAESALVEGLPLIIPAGVITHHNNALTYRPYDPLEVLGNTSPTTPVPVADKNGKCATLGQVLLAVIAIAVVLLTRVPITNFLAFGSTVAPVTAAGVTISAGAGATIVGGAVAGAAGSIVSQGVGVMTGIQDKFSWNAVALAAIGGGVGAGVGTTNLGVVAQAVTSNAITQGIAVVTGLQDKFSWAGLAAAGVGAWAGGQFDHPIVSSTASLIADAATRSLIEGTNFGDNILAALPNVIGQLAAGAIVGGMSRRESPVYFKRQDAELLPTQYSGDLKLVDAPELRSFQIDSPRQSAQPSWVDRLDAASARTSPLGWSIPTAREDDLWLSPASRFSNVTLSDVALTTGATDQRTYGGEINRAIQDVVVAPIGAATDFIMAASRDPMVVADALSQFPQAMDNAVENIRNFDLVGSVDGWWDGIRAEADRSGLGSAMRELSLDAAYWGTVGTLAVINPEFGAADDVLLATRPMGRSRSLLTRHPDAHSFSRHGGVVTDEQLLTRALTGLTPDGYQASFIPRLSSAFHSDDLLIWTDQQIRANGALQAAIAARPGQVIVNVTPDLVGDLGVDLGRGYARVAGPALNSGVQGPPRLVTNLQSARGTYALNPNTGNWETITLYPERWP